MKWTATAVGLTFSLCLFTASPVSSAEVKEDEEEQKILLPEQTEIDLTADTGGFFRFSGVGMFAASAGDLATTEWGLTRQGVYESNPISTHRGVRIATHVVAPAVVWWTTEKMHQKGHKKLAFVLRIGLMVAYSYAAMHNIRTVNNP